MADVTALQDLMVQLARGGIDSLALRTCVMSVYPELSDSAYFSGLSCLQASRRLMGSEEDGHWVFASATDEEIANTPLEYSPEFAEMIIAADCGEWTELDPDELMAELEEMLKKANARRSGKA